MARLNARILCVDGDAATRDLLISHLQRFGLLPCAASSAHEAIRIAGSEPVDVCVFNFQLPDMDGEQFAQEIRNLLARTPLIMISGNGDVSPAALGLVDRFIPKDSWLERSLVSEIIELLGGAGAVA